MQLFHRAAFRDVASSNLSNVDMEVPFKPSSHHDVGYDRIGLSKIRIHLDLIPSRTKSLVDEGAAFLMEPAALQQAAVHSGFAPAHVRAPASTAATHMFAQPQASLHLGFEVGGFSHGKSYATDVAEIIARSQASMLLAQQRGLPLPPADVRRAVAPVDAVPSGTWAHDDEQFAGVDAHADHHRQYSPLPSLQHNENSLNHAISPTYLQGNVSSRSHSRLHVGGSERDVDASAEQRPQKKAWELEVERLRLTMQQQHLAGSNPPPAPPTDKRDGVARPSASVIPSIKPQPTSATSDKSKKGTREQPEKTKPAPGARSVDKAPDASKKLTGQDKYRMEKMKDRKPASSDVSGANDLGDADSVMLSAHPSSNDAPGEIRGQPHPLAKFMNAAGLVTLDTFAVQSPSFARISPFLILGDYHTSASLETLRAENVVAVVNATTEVACHFPTLLAYLRVPVHDDMHEDLYPHFSASLGFINDYSQRGTVLVHCLAGRCRSATIVLAHMIACGRLSLLHAMTALHELKPDIRPNGVFSQQLLRLELEVHRKNSMSFVGSKLMPL